MRAAKVQASLRIRAVSPEPPLLAHTSSESWRTVRQKARSLASLNGWTCVVKICHDGMLEDTNSLDGAHTVWITTNKMNLAFVYHHIIEKTKQYIHVDVIYNWNLMAMAWDYTTQPSSHTNYDYQQISHKIYHKTWQQHFSHDMTKPTKWVCAQRRLRSAWASAQSDQSLRCPHEESLGP